MAKKGSEGWIWVVGHKNGMESVSNMGMLALKIVKTAKNRQLCINQVFLASFLSSGGVYIRRVLIGLFIYYINSGINFFFWD